MPMAQLGAIDLYYERAGQGAPLLTLFRAQAAICASGLTCSMDQCPRLSTFSPTTSAVSAVRPSPTSPIRWPATPTTRLLCWTT